MTDLSERPLCDCHGEPMRWNKDASRKAGGRWRCRAKHREAQYRCREANPEKYRERERRAREANPEKYRERFRRWARANPEKIRENNTRRLMVCGMYLGMCGFTEREREAILRGAAE